MSFINTSTLLYTYIYRKHLALSFLTTAQGGIKDVCIIENGKSMTAGAKNAQKMRKN